MGGYTWLILLLTIASALSLNVDVKNRASDPSSAYLWNSPPETYPSEKVKVENCGYAPILNKPESNVGIFGGIDVIPHAYPWLVAIYDDDYYLCNGMIISDEWILSSAYCVRKIHYADVIAGGHDLTKDEETRVIIRSREIYMHENFTDAFHYNDISLIHLPVKLPFNDYIQPACLPAYSDPIITDGDMANLTAWGVNSSGIATNVPNQVTVPVLSDAQCKYFYKIYYWDHFVCTAATGYKGACIGDTGGPVNYKKTPDGPTYVRGIISFWSSGGCPHGPSGHTRIHSYLDWISDISGIAIDP